MIFILIGLGIIFLIDIISYIKCYYYDYRCDHKWKKVYNTKYGNIGFRKHYYIISVCKNCGKRKITKE